jgi:ribosomal protein S18 acetylase RimI-like enzyme
VFTVTRVTEQDWRSERAARLELWVPADNPRARACYQRQGFLATGRSRPFPGSSGRFIDEMLLDLAAARP